MTSPKSSSLARITAGTTSVVSVTRHWASWLPEAHMLSVTVATFTTRRARTSAAVTV